MQSIAELKTELAQHEAALDRLYDSECKLPELVRQEYIARHIQEHRLCREMLRFLETAQAA